MSIFGEKSIKAALQVGPFKHLSPEERATEYRARQAREILAAAEAALDREGLADIVSDVWQDPGQVTPPARSESFEHWLGRAIVARLFPTEGGTEGEATHGD